MEKETLYSNNLLEALLYPFFILIFLWSVFYVDATTPFEFYELGVLPRQVEGLKGIFFMPFVHSQRDFNHILSNSIPIFVLTALLIYFYKSIALRVWIIIWLATGFLTWSIAQKGISYHIGISGIIYGLFGFLFLSGVIRRNQTLWGISLMVIFLYGSLIWGIFPTKEPISWEGHLSGFLAGILCAISFRKMGPQATKYRYEIEEELGIEPPDLEGIYNKKIQEAQERYLAMQNVNKELSEQTMNKSSNHTSETETRIIYLYKPNPKPADKIDDKE
ncbi:MAG: rhomboid family intramembrane serine protease [Lishizhenia sp.]